jgi:hypothetical protein
MESNVLNDREMRRIELIIDEVFVDLRIDPASPCASNTREFIARLLFDSGADVLPDPIATRTLTARVRSFGLPNRFSGLG